MRSVLCQQAAHVIVDADRVRYRLEIVSEHGGNLARGHLGLDSAGSGLGCAIGVHWQMQQHFLARALRLFRERGTVNRVRKNGNGDGSGERAPPLAWVIADIINDDTDYSFGRRC